MLSSPTSARLGNTIGAIAMALAVVATMVAERPASMTGMMIAMVLGSVVGIISAQKVKMTAMPQMVALFNGVGGLASVLVSVAEGLRFFDTNTEGSVLFSVTSWFSVAVGAVTFTGSMIAFFKLQELMPTRPILVRGQRIFTLLLFIVTVAAVYLLIENPSDMTVFAWLAVTAGLLGVLLVIPIGGADMPVVISLLNSYSGLAAMAAGFVVNSNVLIISGALVGASGVILTRLMCQAMNRSLINVVFGAFGGVDVGKGSGDEKPMKEFSPMDAAMLLANASKVIMVPGYGLAVSQAQANLRELADELKLAGIHVAYAIHPVAGRMPGHMNVLLAEADVPYQELFDLEHINSEFELADVAIIVGANDVVNPLARTDKTSPLYGMPILNADKAKSVIVLKRGRGRGFAGIENPLFTMDNAGVVFGDAKQTLIKVLQSVKGL
jgi:NAD(P) transhydrogenase subunit beta